MAGVSHEAIRSPCAGATRPFRAARGAIKDARLVFLRVDSHALFSLEFSLGESGSTGALRSAVILGF